MNSAIWVSKMNPGLAIHKSGMPAKNREETTINIYLNLYYTIGY